MSTTAGNSGSGSTTVSSGTVRKFTSINPYLSIVKPLVERFEPCEIANLRYNQFITALELLDSDQLFSLEDYIDNKLDEMAAKDPLVAKKIAKPDLTVRNKHAIISNSVDRANINALAGDYMNNIQFAFRCLEYIIEYAFGFQCNNLSSLSTLFEPLYRVAVLEMAEENYLRGGSAPKMDALVSMLSSLDPTLRITLIVAIVVITYVASTIILGRTMTPDAIKYLAHSLGCNEGMKEAPSITSLGVRIMGKMMAPSSSGPKSEPKPRISSATTKSISMGPAKSTKNEFEDMPF